MYIFYLCKCRLILCIVIFFMFTKPRILFKKPNIGCFLHRCRSAGRWSGRGDSEGEQNQMDAQGWAPHGRRVESITS